MRPAITGLVLLALVLSVCLVSGCALPKVDVTPLTKTEYPVNRGSVDILDGPPDEAFAKVARLEVNDEDGDMEALSRKAASLGADAIIMDERKTFRDSVLAPYGAKARYRTGGIAIKYLRPSLPPKAQ
ncbi:MAG: hypothetical protein ACNI3A_11240 [Desulfovibrio sp.]|uniref:hypothetical protein n=1 Tax=Desulfovibrio sp. 7SRBS1 TaxID=3378064 RepID=UPI003B41BAFC